MAMEYVKTGDVARRFSVTKVTVLRWIEKGLLKASKLPGGHNRITKEELIRFEKSLGK